LCKKCTNQKIKTLHKQRSEKVWKLFGSPALWLLVLQIWRPVEPSTNKTAFCRTSTSSSHYLANCFPSKTQRSVCVQLFGLVAGLVAGQHVQVFAVVSQCSLSHQRLHSLALQNNNPAHINHISMAYIGEKCKILLV
jgi:hypothetical protein